MNQADKFAKINKSSIRFYPVTETLGMIAVSLLLAALVGILLWQRRRLTRTRSLILRGREALLRSQKEMKRLADELMQSEEAEKSRLARELHDDISQRLAALALGMEHLDTLLEGAPREARAAIKLSRSVSTGWRRRRWPMRSNTRARPKCASSCPAAGSLLNWSWKTRGSVSIPSRRRRARGSA